MDMVQAEDLMMMGRGEGRGDLVGRADMDVAMAGAQFCVQLVCNKESRVCVGF